jgi:branched-chain amino acid transport system substrate-binding protein
MQWRLWLSVVKILRGGGNKKKTIINLNVGGTQKGISQKALSQKSLKQKQGGEGMLVGLKKRKVICGIVVLCFLAVMVGVAGCSSSAKNASSEPLKIGLIQPLTGSCADAGNAVKAGAEIARDKINAAGGINGQQIELVEEDGANDPATSATAATKLITEDNVLALIAAWGSSPTLAVEPITKSNKVPLIIDTASSAKCTDKNAMGNDWAFRLAPPSAMEAAAIKPHLGELGIKNVYFLSVNNDWGRGATTDVGKVISDNGGQIVGSEYFDDSENNFAPFLTRIKNTSADTIVLTTDAPQIALVAEQARTLGLTQKILTTGGSNFLDEVIKIGGAKNSEGVYATLFYSGAYDPSKSANPDEAKAFNDAYKAKGLDWTTVQEAARGYDSVMTLAAAIKTLPANGVTRQGIRDALVKVHLKGIIYGDISFGVWGNFINQNAAPIAIAQVVNGAPKIIIDPTVPQAQ